MEKSCHKKVLRIAFNGRPFCQEQMRGLSRHTLELILNLKKKNPEAEVYIYAYDKISDFYKKLMPFAHFHDQKVKPKILWDLWLLGKQLKRDKIDLFHSTNNLGVPFLLTKRIPLFVTIHDHFTHETRIRWGRSLRAWWASLNYRIELILLKRAQHFFTVSEDAKRKISFKLSIPIDKITVTYNGANLIPLSALGSKESFYLYVGGLEERKNIKVMLDAFLAFSTNDSQHPKLKLAGSPHMASLQVKELLEKNKDIFVLTGAISDAQLTELYQTAEALIFPSLEEGFGLPMVEAMILGCPVVASNIDVFYELAKEEALFFEVRDSHSLAEKLTYLSSHPEMRDQMIKAGIKRAHFFTWEKMMQGTFEIYKRFLPQ